MVELCGAKLVPGTIDEAAEVPIGARAGASHERVERLLGMEIEPGESETYLQRLGFGVTRESSDLKVTVPFHRHYDVTREVDLVEEVGRIHGYAEHLPSTLPGRSGQTGGLTREQRLRRRAEDSMRDLGFDAVVDLSLTDPGMPGRLRIPEGDLRAAPIRVSNPLSAEHSVERTALVGSLLDAARYNRAHGAERVALFESGRAYLREGCSPHQGVLAGKFVGEGPAPAFEPWRIGAIASGPLRPGGLARRGGGRRLLLAEGGPRGARGPTRRRGGGGPRRGALPASGPERLGAGRGSGDRLDRRAPPAGLPFVGPGERPPASSSTWRRWSPPRPSARRPTRT